MPIEYSREQVTEWENDDLKVVVQYGNRYLYDKSIEGGYALANQYTIKGAAQKWVQQKIKARIKASEKVIERLEYELDRAKNQLDAWEEREKRLLK